MTLPLRVRDCAHTSADPDPSFEDDDWLEFDPTGLESWILDDFDWEIEDVYPERGDFSGDPLTQRELSE
jgi:hypothetical protein